MPRDLSRLLRPASIAVIGGGAWGAGVVEQAARVGFAGAVWPVHPRRAEIGGAPAWRRIEDLPGVPDAAFVAINRVAAVEAVAALRAAGAGGAVCFASGFAEAEDGLADGPALQAALVEAAGEMPLLGPNCYGLLNYLDRVALWPDQHGGRARARGVAIVAQSSNMLINLTMVPALPVAYAVAAGNQAQTSQAEIALALLDDNRVSALGLHVEGVRDLRAWEVLADLARARRVPVVALKVGRSAAAQAGTLTHTASLAGDVAASDAFFRRLGIGRVAGLPEFAAALTLLHGAGALPGRRVASVSCSGGEANLVADMAEGRALDLAPLPEGARARLGEVLGPKVTLANPLDYHTYIWGDAAAMTATFAAVLGAGYDLTLVVVDFPHPGRCSDAAWDCAAAALRGARAETGGRIAVVATLPGGIAEARAEAFLDTGIVPIQGVAEALSAAEAAAEIGAAWARRPAAPLAPAPAIAGPAETLDEAAAKALLAAYGVPVPEGRRATTPEDAASAAAALGGRLALKALGHAHKTEEGAVRLGLGPEDVAAAARAMPGAHGFLVERMAEGAVAELLMGVTRDPAHGFALTVGAGGVLAELLADTATVLLPAGDALEAALDRLRCAPLLAGYRGRPAGDRAALLAAARALEAFALAEAPRLLEVEINPLIVTPRGVWAVDALVRRAPGPGDPA